MNPNSVFRYSEVLFFQLWWMMNVWEGQGQWRDLGSQEAKLPCESRVCRVDLEELHDCSDGPLHEDQVLCGGGGVK